MRYGWLVTRKGSGMGKRISYEFTFPTPRKLKQKRNKNMRRDRMGKFAKSQLRKVVEFEALLLGSVAVVGLLIYFWTPIAIAKAGEKLASVYTQGF